MPKQKQYADGRLLPSCCFYYAGAAASRGYRRDLCHQKLNRHIITYTPGALWDENTETDSSGAARLPFDLAYENASADNGENDCPGTQRESGFAC
ncbi:MAG: hypothetical protein ACLR56_05110 [Oscillospiraceae bacterium]